MRAASADLGPEVAGSGVCSCDGGADGLSAAGASSASVGIVGVGASSVEVASCDIDSDLATSAIVVCWTVRWLNGKVSVDKVQVGCCARQDTTCAKITITRRLLSLLLL